MSNQEQRNNIIRKILIIAEITSLAIIMAAIANFIWQNAGITSIDTSLQIAFIGTFFLVITLAANYVLDRRW